MKKNFKLTVEASSLRRPGSSEKLIGANGEFNASNKADLLQTIASFIAQAADKEIVTEASNQTANAETRRQVVQAAFNDKNELAALGDTIADEITMKSNRDGFARRFLQYQDLAQGQIPQVRMSRKDIVVSVATGPTEVATQFVRDNIMYPQEVYISARPYIEQREIDRASGDILEQKYTEALEATMVAEDRLWKRAADRLVGVHNPHINVSGAFDPKAFALATSYLQNSGATPGFALLSADLWQDIVANPDWAEIIDPVSKHELLLTGKLGTIHGMEILSDQFRHVSHKVLEKGEFYIVSTPDQHGQFTDRGGVVSQPIDGTQERVPGRGWFMSESVSLVIANPYSVVRGRRI